MPVKNDSGDESGADSAESSPGHESSDEEANEIESDDSEMINQNEIEQRRSECIDYLANLERQFGELREQYYLKRISQIERQITDIRNGRSDEFLMPLKDLDKVYRNRIEVSDVLRKYRLENIEHKYLSEEQAAIQHFESEKYLALDQIHDDLLEKIRRLEEDRHNVDISWADWGTDRRTGKVRGPGRKKAITVTGPYIVYMLHEEDIIDDWTTIRKAVKRTASSVQSLLPALDETTLEGNNIVTRRHLLLLHH